MRLTFRTFSLAVAYTAFFVLAAVSHQFHIQPPSPIKVVKYTESWIKNEYLQEVKEKESERALARKAKALARSVAAARAVYRATRCGDRYSDLTGRVAYEYGLPARLLAAVVFVESTCRPTAVSGRDSVGLMQINPKVWKFKKAELLDPEKNLRIGARILKTYIARFGVIEGLHHYNGLGEPTNEYADKVLTAEGWTVAKREDL